ncbi:SET and MYND domain-containing protein 4 [Lepeophtheirus salmonis]|uniref:SET and MYND domain-containing protein 4 n=1 Tax=Lepeophtheirus salmonis TaxID=72036 RepID=UPI001AE6EAB7|nr:uncharacterized protein LOC121122970 [Lepeophtheirus salmonis]
MISSEERDKLLSSLGIGNAKDLEFLSSKFGKSLPSSDLSPSTPIKKQGKYPFYNLVDNIRSEIRSKSTYKRVFEKTNSFRPRWDHVVQYISKDHHMITLMNEEREGENIRLKRAEDLKKQGNECYGRKRFKEAVRVYTLAIKLAGLLKEPGALLGILLGNRSASFYQLRDYQTSLDDIKGAFHFGYPPELMHKLVDRRARCRFALGDSLKDIRSEIMEAHLDTKNMMEHFETFVSSSKSNPKATSKKSKQHKNLIEDILDFPRHERVPQLAKYVDITYTKELGRHGLALRDIQPGEPILYEQPLVFHCNPSFSEEHCYDCGASLSQKDRLLGLFPHLTDGKSSFCAWSCFENWISSSGIYETKFNMSSLFRGVNLEETRSSGAVNLAYEAMIRHSYDYYAKTMRGANGALIPVDPEFGSTLSEKAYVSTDVRTLYDLEGHRNSRKDDEECLTLLVHTWILIQCLEKSEYFPSSGEGDREFIAELIHHFLVGIKYNLHSVDRVDGSMERVQARGPISFESIGSGIFPTLLLLNHSCATNTVRHNLRGSHVLVLAKSFIPAGAEVTDCYGAHHLSTNTTTRQKDLVRGYNFDCGCLACAGGDKKYPQLGKLGTPLRGKEEVWESYVRGFLRDVPRESFKRIVEYLKSFGGGRSPDRNLEKGGIALCIVMWKAINGNQ